ncbi:hypothetical protein HYC85_011681 [Camellia sinensis]|uniref:DUF4220 domain-containing protein n=1 Tax=Camellia sinensis TaxID=4442 RepID=A0A7J7HCU9_CAMSI|nr:hypothetical protein HYC85_011681 [Camellia sinensis]
MEHTWHFPGNHNGKELVNKDNAVFWAPFLLLHLSGPNTITAFALEDNELWLRHLLSLMVQFVAVAYVFLQSLPNEFWIPTLLMFVAGTIKYAEQTRALYLVCLGNFKASMLPKPEAGIYYPRLMEEYSSNMEAHVPVKIVFVKEVKKRSKDLDAQSSIKKPTEEIDGECSIQVLQNFQGTNC